MYSKAWFTFRVPTLNEAALCRQRVINDHSHMTVTSFEVQERQNSANEFIGYIVYVGISDGTLDD